ncbi:hypothetical protein ACA910_012508 [Epithemia clementina (nom. ined.)]
MKTWHGPIVARFIRSRKIGGDDEGDEEGNSAVVPFVANETGMEDFEHEEEEHVYDALTSLLLNVTIIGCLIFAYYVKKFRIYYLPESAGSLIVGIILGGIARISTDKLVLFEFSPEVFFFVLLPPIIFEAGYSLNWNQFFENIGAITLYAMVGTIISTFVVGGLSFYAARMGLIRDVDNENPMEALLFGALISAVDPVATLSIMGNAELRCDPLLYSLVFGESVLNDAIAISLFKVFAKYYDPTGPDWSESEIPNALLSFLTVSFLSVLLGVMLGLVASFLFKHTGLSDYPKLETSLLFSFCYLCYAFGESIGLSGIMAIFFHGVTLSHYNSYNLSSTAHVASEHIFSTLSTIAETVVFLYMGMGVFTGRFKNYDVVFSVLALGFCCLGRLLNIFPLSWIANCCRTGRNRISMQMQVVLWFAGLRGAIAFALAMNMPGKNKDVYATATLSICIFTTVVCGGLTDRMLTEFGMKGSMPRDDDDGDDDGTTMHRLVFQPTDNNNNNNSSNGNGRRFPLARNAGKRAYRGMKKLWTQFDDDVLKVYFGGDVPNGSGGRSTNGGGGGGYELATRDYGNNNSSDDEDHVVYENGDDSSEDGRFLN